MSDQLYQNRTDRRIALGIGNRPGEPWDRYDSEPGKTVAGPGVSNYRKMFESAGYTAVTEAEAKRYLADLDVKAKLAVAAAANAKAEAEAKAKAEAETKAKAEAKAREEAEAGNRAANEEGAKAEAVAKTSSPDDADSSQHPIIGVASAPAQASSDVTEAHQKGGRRGADRGSKG